MRIKQQYNQNQNYSETDLVINNFSISRNYLIHNNVLRGKSEKDSIILDIQITCFSYWKVFESRFLDYYHMIIITKMVYYFRDNLEINIEKKYSPAASQVASDCLTEDVNISKRRIGYLKSMTALEKAKEELEKILNFH